MATTIYSYFFDSLSRDSSGKNIPFRVDIVDDPYVPQAVAPSLSPTPSADTPKYYGGGSPFAVTYDYKEKLTPILGSGATFEIVVTEDMLARNLFTDDIRKYKVILYKSGVLEWVGWLESETYSESLADSAPYPVTFYAADFNVLKRVKFLDRKNGNKPYTGFNSLWEILCICYGALWLAGGLKEENVFTTTSNETGSGVNMLKNTVVSQENFYDEDGKPMSMYEVLEEVLRPFGLVTFIRGWDIYIADYNTIYENAKFDFGTIIDKTKIDGRHAVTSTASTSGSYGFEDLKNNLTVTASRYASISKIDYSVQKSELSELFQTIVSRDTQVKYELYHACKDFIIEGASAQNPTFLCATSLDGKANERIGMLLGFTGSGWAQSKYTWEGELIFNSDYMIQSAVQGTENNFNLNMDLISWCNQLENHDVPPNIFTEYAGAHGYSYGHDAGRLANTWGTGAFNIVDDDGNVLCSYDFPQKGKGSWKTGAGGVLNWYHMPGKKLQKSDASCKLVKMSIPIDTDGMEGKRNDGINIPAPPFTGYPQFVIKKFQLFGRDDSYKDKNHYDGRNMYGILINNIIFNAQGDYGIALNTDDVVLNSHININAENDCDEVTVILTSYYDKGMATGRANLLNKNGKTPITKFTRTGQTLHMEELLVCTIHSNNTGVFERFDCDIQGVANPISMRSQYGRYGNTNENNPKKGQWIIGDSSTYYIINGCEINYKEGFTTLNCVGFSKDVKKITEVTEKKRRRK
ncbi:hypothetical protein Barb6XT_00103 [Bacteroidales bacterium Barb6XT]|nr:hypothetical protein Barb6XT_00103 [Bacteroidales bacterium Barb6XT]